MAFHSSMSAPDETPNSLMMNERDRLDTADTCACPTSAELSKAVSVSLGLDTVSSPLNNVSQCSSSNSAFTEFEPSVENSSRGVTGLGAAHNMNSDASEFLLSDTNQREDDFGRVCHGIQQVSCMDLLRSGEMDSAQTVTRGPMISRYVCKEANLFMSPAAEVPASSQVDEVLPLKQYPVYSANSSQYRDSPSSWCAYSGRSEPERSGSGGPGGHTLLCKYCNCGQVSRGSKQECHCVWYSKGEQNRKGGTRAVMAQEYGQVESYQSPVPQGHASFSTIKTEPSVWVDCTDRSFRRVCQVCGDDASGCHYGAVTCGSCKVFFKRAAAGRRLKGAGQTRNGEGEQPLAPWGPGERGERPGKKDVILEPGSAVLMAQTPAQVMALGIPPTVRSCLSLLSVLQSIEPAIVNAGHDHALPDSPASLLTSLNELGERQLVTVVRWAKAIPGFRDLHVDDQMSVIQLSWMGVMVFALGWRSYTLTNSSMLYFAPDLVFNDQRMQVSSMYEHCVRMKLLSQRFCMLKVTQEEFLCMKALVLFSIMPVEGLKSQRCFDELRTSYIKELDRLASHRGETTRTQRLFQLTQLLDYLQSIVRKLHQFTYDVFIQAQSLQTRVNFPEMISEIVSVHVPKILSGMVKPILFHNTA
ncbi:Androgen receptor [Nibea albiflora]|uniref:Androgen receptor n=1 Tax=Nibea albiflora TaxID=240163 RepID=A0ACB7EPY4_NIBAL|nr:Androgen receptor [Nibea albiflora]